MSRVHLAAKISKAQRVGVKQESIPVAPFLSSLIKTYLIMALIQFFKEVVFPGDYP